MGDVLWQGEHDGMQVRILQADKGVEDCIVEVHISYHGEERWDALNDDAACAAVYMTAYLECRKALNMMFDRDMGNLSLRGGVSALETAGRLLGRSE
jgi:hypothetical protein